jgi:hypothetical protein
MSKVYRDADEADVFAHLKRPGSGAAHARAEAEEAMRKANVPPPRAVELESQFPSVDWT